MKRIITVALNPAIDKSASVAHVVAEHKLYCTPPRFEPGGGGVNVSRAIKNWEAIHDSFILQGA